VWVSPQLLHHDPRYFLAPLEFRPERFLNGELSGGAADAYLPFGAGPRTCIGNHASLFQIALVGMLTVRRCTIATMESRDARS
jgi:cytochrome P450